jgi:tetratricopeptide (TPR) repeat protein
MAQRARSGAEPEVLSGALVDEADIHDDTDDGGQAPIDRLLAETDEGWDVEEQRLTLKQAAATMPAQPSEPLHDDPAAPPAGGRVHVPTAFDLAPTRVPDRRLKAPPKVPAKPPPPLPRKPSLTPSPGSVRSEPSPARAPADMAQPDALIDLLSARVTTLEAAQPVDAVSLARTHMELAIASETLLGDDARATRHANFALGVQPGLAAAHWFQRRKEHGRPALASMLAHLEKEILAATTDAHKVELLAERARMLDALGGRTPEARATWEQVLDHAPHHPAALSGLEAELLAQATASGSPSDWDALATHLGRMADAYATETHLAAWLHVERADVLERRLSRIDAALGALERALQLDPGLGPVRNRLTRHAAAHGDWSRLAKLLEDEAQLEASDARAARLELDAAVIADTRLDDAARACELLEKAARRGPTGTGVDRRVLDELVRLHERAGRHADAARCRRARLRYVTDPPTLAYELRILAAAAERDGDLETAVMDVQRALGVEATDPTLAEMLDRLLAATGKHDQRIAAWLQEAARTEDGAARARSLSRAARICEELGRRDDALKHHRSAWIASPGDPDVLEALARLLAPTLSEATDSRARSLVEIYAQAAEQAREPGRKVAHLERAALLWEEVLGDPTRAARAYSDVLALDPDRRTAILGLERTAGRAGDARTLARALLDEARLAEDEAERLALRVRAARALAKHDPTRAMQLVREVLASQPWQAEALVLETQLEEEAGRWDLAARSLRRRVDVAPTTAEKVALWLAVAQVERTRLHAPLEALGALEQALALDPAHPVPPQEIARVLEDRGDARALRDAVERLAARAKTPEERAGHLGRAAEIDELWLGDDASAMRTYQRALGETPDDELVVDRLARVMARCAGHSHGRELAELAALLGKRIERAPSPAVAMAESFELAALLVETGHELGRAAAILEATLADQPDHAPALRTLEALRRRSGDVQALARVLAKQGEDLTDVRARLGALWSLAALEEWRLPVGDVAATYRQILELDPTDPGALEATVRHELATARGGDPRARKSAVAALRALLPFAPDDDSRLVHQLGIALLLEACAADTPDRPGADDLQREALERYRDALRIDPLSVSAATGLARLSGRVGEVECALAASLSLADLAADPRARARYLVDASEILLGPDGDARLGARADRRARAGTLLERALEADPESIAAAGRLATVMAELHQEERLVSAFRGALGRAKSPDAVVMLGSEVARVARDDLKDLAIAIDAMQIVRAVAPQHVTSLLTLAELCIAQRVWPEAVSALEAVVSVSREAPPKLMALFALASIYEKVLARPGDVDRVLRAALALDAGNARALRALLRRIAAGPPREDAAAERSRQGEIADLLERLSEAETDPDQRAGLLVELSEARLRRREEAAAERALVEAVATSPGNARAFARLATLFRRPQGSDQVGYARALNAVIGLGEAAGRVDARWFAALGQIEVQALSRPTEGLPHLRRAVTLDPALYETRFELASALAATGANEEAARVLLDLLAPTAHPIPLLSVADPAVALALLGQVLTALRHRDEAVVVNELLAVAGELDETGTSWLRARRLGPAEGPAPALDRAAIAKRVFPAESDHVLREVARAIAGTEGKVLRTDLAELGLTQRDRIGPRSGHPTRALLDRLCRLLGVDDVELAVSTKTERTRVVAQDDPWVVVPAALLQMPESRQLASLARAVARIALGLPWLGELPLANTQGLLIGAARQVAPSYGSADLDPQVAALASQYTSLIARATSRRHRKLLEELAPRLAGKGDKDSTPPAPFVDFLGALLRAELRTALLVTGDTLSLLEDLASSDAELGEAIASPGPAALSAVLRHPLAADLVRFALTPEATALRRRAGATWAR